MAHCDIRAFSDPDDYAAAFGAAKFSVTISGPGDFTARITRLRLQHLDLYCCTERLSRIAFVSLPSDRLFVSFPFGTGSSFVTNGHVLSVREMVFHGNGGRTCQVINKACQWGLLSLSSDQFARTSKALSGRKLTTPDHGSYLRPTRAHVGRFHCTFGKACRLAESRRGLIEHPEVRRAVEQDLLHALVNCLVADQVESWSKHHHAANVIARFEEVIGNRIGEKLSIPALCTELDIPERTLRTYCTKFLGIGPSRYFLLHRLNRVRRALQDADPSTSSVAKIAEAHQFSQLGRFARVYRSVFGELPSVTLQRSIQSRRISH
jgi:AraC-like DNA-binding protein